MAAPAAGLALTLLSLVGCRTSVVAIQNLDAVLSSTDSFRYQGRVTNVWSDLARSSVGALKTLGGAAPQQPDIVDIPNPTKLALNNLLELAASNEGNAAWRHNEKVRTFARFATSAPSQLCRERAILELVPHARRLGITEIFVPRDINANAPELLEALDGLVDAARTLLAEGDSASTTTQIDFDAAIAVLENTPVNVQGGSRMLRAMAPFIRGNRVPAEQRERLVELSERVQGELIREALFAGLVDRSDVVRAAALRSNMAVHGEAFAIEALLKVVPGRRGGTPVDKAYSKFSVPQIPIEFDESIFAVCGAFERGGLPVAARERTTLGVETRGTIYDTLWRIAINDLMFSSRVRNAAMRALKTVSDGALDTLRAEEWDRWFREVGPALQAEFDALKAAEAAGAENGGAGADGLVDTPIDVSPRS